MEHPDENSQAFVAKVEHLDGKVTGIIKQIELLLVASLADKTMRSIKKSFQPHVVLPLRSPTIFSKA